MTGVIVHLVALVRGVSEGSTKLDVLLAQQRTMMIKLEDLTKKMDAINVKASEIAAAQEAQAVSQQTVVTTTANIAADVQRLKDLIGAGTPGLTEEEAATADSILAGVLENVSTVAASAQAAATALTDSAASLQALADSTPEDAPPAEPAGV